MLVRSVADAYWEEHWGKVDPIPDWLRKHVRRESAKACLAREIPERKWDATPCWVWRGAVSKGYGRRYAGNSINQIAHRWVWEKANGPLPVGARVCHHSWCAHKLCVNPGHLFLDFSVERKNNVKSDID